MFFKKNWILPKHTLNNLLKQGKKTKKYAIDSFVKELKNLMIMRDYNTYRNDQNILKWDQNAYTCDWNTLKVIIDI